MIVAVMADKGGVGKTTAAHNLGCEIARRGERVLLVDADKQADLTELAGVASTPNVATTVAPLEIVPLMNFELVGGCVASVVML